MRKVERRLLLVVAHQQKKLSFQNAPSSPNTLFPFHTFLAIKAHFAFQPNGLVSNYKLKMHGLNSKCPIKRTFNYFYYFDLFSLF